MAKNSKLPANYENNPFFIAVNGISLIFNLARGVAFLLVAIAILGIYRGDVTTGDSKTGEEIANTVSATIAGWQMHELLLAIAGVGIVVLAILLVAALFGGVAAYTSAKIARNETVGLGEAFRVAFDHLWSFLWLQIILFVKILLWSLLFIVPGIIMATRYSLASVAFFDEKKNLRGNAAIKESIRMTRGAWITTYGANALFNFITFGVISSLVTTGANAILYRQFDKLGDKKPDAHWLSWVALVLPFAILTLLFIFFFFLVVIAGVSGAQFS